MLFASKWTNCTFFPQTEYFINSVFPCDDENDVPANTRFYILNAAQGEMSTPIAELEGALVYSAGVP